MKQPRPTNDVEQYEGDAESHHDPARGTHPAKRITQFLPKASLSPRHESLRGLGRAMGLTTGSALPSSTTAQSHYAQDLKRWSRESLICRKSGSTYSGPPSQLNEFGTSKDVRSPIGRKVHNDSRRILVGESARTPDAITQEQSVLNRMHYSYAGAPLALIFLANGGPKSDVYSNPGRRKARPKARRSAPQRTHALASALRLTPLRVFGSASAQLGEIRTDLELLCTR